MQPHFKNAYHWDIATCLKINPNDPTVLLPKADPDFAPMDENILLWDTWQLENKDGQWVSFNGWHILFCLCTTIDHREEEIVERWEDRNNTAFIGSFVSRDGYSWKYNGRVLDPSCDIRPYEWSGSTRLENNHGDISLFYTSVSEKEQIPSLVRGRIVTSAEGVAFEGMTETIELIRPDELHEASIIQNQYAALRDPRPFHDPETGEDYLIYEIDLPQKRGEYPVDDDARGHLPPDMQGLGNRWATGGIGISRAIGGDYTNLEHLPPLLTSFGSCVQTERPKMIYHNGKYYLFTITHGSMFCDGVTGSDGLYGFVSDSLFGERVPMNGSGQVILNRKESPQEAYSYDIGKGEDGGFYASYFLDKVMLPDGSYRIGGTLGDTAEIAIERYNSYVIGNIGTAVYPVVADVSYD